MIELDAVEQHTTSAFDAILFATQKLQRIFFKPLCNLYVWKLFYRSQ